MELLIPLWVGRERLCGRMLPREMLCVTRPHRPPSPVPHPAEDGRNHLACQDRARDWYRDPEQLTEEYAAHGTFNEISKKHGGSPTTYSQSWRRLGLPKQSHGPKARTTPDTEELTLDAERLDDIKGLLRDRGLNPDEWVVTRVVANTWDGFVNGDHGPETVPLRQLKVTLRPRLEMLLIPACEMLNAARLHVRPKSPRKSTKSGHRLVVFVGDEQAPYHDRQLHDLFRQWLARNKPDEGIHLGDLMDLPTISRHRPNPEWNASVQECVQAGLRDPPLATAKQVFDTPFGQRCPGNHDERLRDYQLQRAPELFGIRVADLDERELAARSHSLATLLHLDALGIKWVGTDADYEHAQVDVSRELVARHGWITGGNSAEKTVRRLGINVVVGHTHRQRVHYITEERRRENYTTLVTVAVEAGCMCKVDGGDRGLRDRAYDWANRTAAFAANVWPDGSFHIDHATYRDGVLTWREQRYE